MTDEEAAKEAASVARSKQVVGCGKYILHYEPDNDGMLTFENEGTSVFINEDDLDDFWEMLTKHDD